MSYVILRGTRGRGLAAVCAAAAILALLAGLTAPVAASPGGSAGPLPATDRPEVVPDAVLAQAHASGSASVIVLLDVDAAPVGTLSAAAAGAQRRAVAAAADRVQAAPGLEAVTVNATFTRLPALALEATPAELAALADAPGVRAVIADEAARPALSSTVPHIGGDALHEEGVVGDGGVVAVLDTGVDADHPAFADGRVAFEACFSRGVDGDPDTGGDCPNGQAREIGPGAAAPRAERGPDFPHGTHVSAIAAGVATGLVDEQADRTDGDGVAPGADIMAVQVFHDAGVRALANTSDTLLGLEWVAEQAAAGVPVAAANLSLGSPGRWREPCDRFGPGPLYQLAAADLAAEGVATIAAAGNEQQRDSVGMPACVSNIVAVGASTIPTDWWTEVGLPVDDPPELAQYSNAGPLIDIVAPGNAVAAVPGPQVQAQNGTSMAAPHVAGAWALLQEASTSTLAPEAILEAITATAEPVSDNRPADPEKGRPAAAPYPELRVAAAYALLADTDFGALAGTVRDADGRPVEGATVTVQDRTASVSRTAVTDAAGAAGVTSLPAGTSYRVSVAAPGYLPQERTAAVSASRTATVEVSLQPAARVTDRRAGPTRVATAARLARDPSLFPAPEVALLASADRPADALSAAPLAAALGAPVLLTNGRTEVEDDVLVALLERGIGAVIIIGGETAVPEAIAEDLRQGFEEVPDGWAVERIAGPNRYATAVAVADRLAEEAGPWDRVVLAGSAAATPDRGWPDALSAAPYAAVGPTAPILLTDPRTLPAETAEAIAGADLVEIVGGDRAVSEAVEAEAGDLAASVTRIAGADRYATSVALVESAVAAGAAPVAALVATGADWADGLAGAAAAAGQGFPLLLVDGADVNGSPGSHAWLAANNPVLVYVIGGPASVNEAVFERINER